MNRITITGRLTKDPELRVLPGGEHACKLRLAVDNMAKGHETGYINVTSFGAPGQSAADVLTKGWLVSVDGRLHYQEWAEEDGTRRHDYELIGHVEFLSAPRSNGTQTPETSEPAEA